MFNLCESCKDKKLFLWIVLFLNNIFTSEFVFLISEFSIVCSYIRLPISD